MSKSNLRKLSELEGVCLGLVRKFQPCTAYQVRRALKASPSSHWQASAGSVYPLLKRLEEAGLISADSDENDGRGRKLLSTTTEGKQALKQWIADGTDPGTVASIMDPIRSRMFFGDVLNEKERRALLIDLIDQMESHLQETRERLASISETEDQFGYFGSLAAVRITEARLDWLKHVQKRL
jgi:DNA-binding PadR family transcriptional regulator